MRKYIILIGIILILVLGGCEEVIEEETITEKCGDGNCGEGETKCNCAAD
jgi:hypothetical protein